MRTCNRIRPDRSASCSAKASGALREPGHSTTSRTPPRISSSTTTRACVVEGFTSTECHSRTVWPGRAQALTLAKNFSIAVLTASGRSKNPR
ncbi:Uncharacterised protein [Mycobacterium tuberculosis]|uniref:Uncharacterized protein n=1 Tax=Mycobacterium tuberculosis TaxID=1773 RepID=A0A0T9E625_MYCTX|nr:Uncharacterised protein [Mycobacterium tuberculosis]CFE70023.1 Uncharacterised protein [Mycobacterium tuberculosis]CFS20111.1 Uncharacterised protein [Mycobacterium tuberculosis]CKQ72582.1 Uncharacterised protein [Mycobacterium tuberculosis]CKS39461.1 Uncharacterised protein [Mycobacterium tuberculosis]